VDEIAAPASVNASEQRVNRPDFIVIGAMKSGTTSLYYYLQAHPEVFMPSIKELDFFTAEMNWKRGWRWYERQFAPAGPQAKAVGEASTTYTKHPEFQGVAKRIATHLPHARLIYIVRHPVERIRSQYQHHVAIGIEKDPLEKAVLRDPSYVDYSRYAMQIEQYLEHFPREQLLIVTSEDLRRDRVGTLGEVYEFVGVDAGAAEAIPAEEHYTTEGRLAYPRIVAGTRRGLRKLWPGSVGVAKFVPQPVKRLLGKPMSRNSASLEMTEGARKEIEDALREDVARLHNYMPADFDGWGIA
jgi:Sulfotransferase domain